MNLANLLPSKETLKYDLNILGSVLVAIPAYYDQFPFIGPQAQQYISFAAFIYGLVSAAARPVRTKDAT